ncbi:hypothetical protein G7Y89_g12065 [Cudoniella acicularis]|uniref:MARVEL domain-containing protein n=1 Tax=Cudoniella acicularis TaxID=354080 RepID=A0A8H4VXQ3_9HELO|nr:hypothetical protein G7Y89_g12065 [Cudoniella acicularis]
MENETTRPKVPIAVPILRGAQVVISLIILGLAADIIHGLYFNQLGFAIVCCIFTWFVAAYALGTLYVEPLKKLNHPIIELASSAFMAVFWLASMGSNAALRLSFQYLVTIDGCYNNGHAIDSSTCFVSRKRDGAVASNAGLSEMSAVAGLSALELLLFIGSLVFSFLSWNNSRRKTGGNTYAPPQKQNEGFQMAPAPQQQQQPYVQQPYVQQPYDQPVPQPQPYDQPQQPYAPQQQYSAPKEGHQQLPGDEETAYQSPVSSQV